LCVCVCVFVRLLVWMRENAHLKNNLNDRFVIVLQE